MKKLSLIKLISAMFIFGTIGAFVEKLTFSSGFIAAVRGLFGAAFLLLLVVIMGKRPSFFAIKRNLCLLVISGVCIGANWFLLFESYRYTGVAVSTLCYYMAPVFVIIFSTFVLKEHLSLKKGICSLVAILGMVLVSGILDARGIQGSQLIGVGLALGAAVLYASVILMNKKMKDISSYDMTVVQLFFAGLVIAPYAFATRGASGVQLKLSDFALLAVVALIHTGIAYSLYFSSVKEIPAQTVAIFSYLDPIVAVSVSALVLRQSMSLVGWLGACLILASAIISELEIPRRTADKA